MTAGERQCMPFKCTVSFTEADLPSITIIKDPTDKCKTNSESLIWYNILVEPAMVAGCFYHPLALWEGIVSSPQMNRFMYQITTVCLSSLKCFCWHHHSCFICHFDTFHIIMGFSSWQRITYWRLNEGHHLGYTNWDAVLWDVIYFFKQRSHMVPSTLEPSTY